MYVQAEGEFRTEADNVGQFRVRNSDGQAVPLSTLVKMQTTYGPEFTTIRFNGYRAAQINRIQATGYSSGQGMQALEEIFAQTMPREMGYNYAGMSFQEKAAAQGVPASAIFGFSLLFVFLILAALYESWSLPFSILLTVPIAVFGAFTGLWMRSFRLGRVCPNRSDRAHRSCRKERHPDRRVRQDRVRERTYPDGGGAGRNEAAPAPALYDLVSVYLRLRAVMDRYGFRERGAKNTGHRGDRGYVWPTQSSPAFSSRSHFMWWNGYRAAGRRVTCQCSCRHPQPPR